MLDALQKHLMCWEQLLEFKEQNQIIKDPVTGIYLQDLDREHTKHRELYAAIVLTEIF